MMLERIEKIEAEARAAIAAAPGTAELEELRVRHLGRKAELTTILRGIAEPAGRGTGRGRRRGQPGSQGARGSCSRRARGSSTRPRWTRAWSATGST